MKSDLQQRPVQIFCNVMIALHLLCAVEGLLCPLERNKAVSLCAMCSHNEAAVRWTKSDAEFTNFILNYNCSGDNITSVDQRPLNSTNDCPWYSWRDIHEGSSGIYSIGRELNHGTVCEFRLFYHIYGERNYLNTTSSCSVDESCESESCIDRVCTFNNDTQEGECTECSCVEGYTGQGCDNINECATSHECSSNASCIDTDGSYLCECLAGFQGDGYNCTDINECETMNETCSNVNAECVNNVGNYSCQCKQGYTGDGDNCTDINECLNETCSDVNAECVNNVGSYSCQCKQGYTGDGDNCTNIDGCSINHECSEYANCIDTDGSYLCQCWLGYTGDGFNCTDINECETMNETCSNVNADCVNNVGSYSCQCKQGYTGDGENCSLISDGSRTDGSTTASLVTVITVITAFVILVLVSAIVIVIVICIRRWRMNSIDLKIYSDTLAVKEFDPFYCPTFITGSLKSIHSVYELLYTLSDNDEAKSIKGSLLEDDDVPVTGQVSPTTPDHLVVDCEQTSNNTSSSSDLSSEEEHSTLPSNNASEDDYTVSKPYIDDKSLLEICRETQRTQHNDALPKVDVEASKATESTINSEESVATPETSLKSSTDSSTLLSTTIPQCGYVTLDEPYQDIHKIIDDKSQDRDIENISDYIEYTGDIIPVSTGD